uniref:CSON003109 protein n=1 Tax=Culicoides sonorensis TaxID=179676 RepID=A0A336MQB1_CULSO
MGKIIKNSLEHETSLKKFAQNISHNTPFLTLICVAEVGSKLRPKSTLQPAVFSYRYGYSFILYIIGILLVFCSGILNVFLYTGFHNATTFNSTVKENSPCFINYSKLRRISVSKPSRRSSINTNAASPCPSERRFVLRKDPNCNVHSNQLAKSLNQLYTEPAPDIAPFDAYPVLTRNVSTTTDNSPPQKKIKDDKDTSSSKLMHNICGIKCSLKSGEKSKEKCINAGTTTTPRAKDIYFIEDDGDTDLSNIFVIEPLETFRRRRGSLYSCGETQFNTLNVQKLRAFNSNHSLSDLDKVFPTNYHNLDTQYYDKLSSSSKIFNGSFGSRTLPRNFVQKNFGYEDSRRVSASGIFLPNNTFDNGKLEQPPISQYNPYTLSNSHSNIVESHRYDLTPPVWPKIIINSPAHQQQQQLPPPMTDNKYSRYRNNNISSINNINGRKISNSCDNILNDKDNGVVGVCRDEYLMNGGGNPSTKTFDLDQIEYERRKSHAVLFDHTGLRRGVIGCGKDGRFNDINDDDDDASRGERNDIDHDDGTPV